MDNSLYYGFHGKARLRQGEQAEAELVGILSEGSRIGAVSSCLVPSPGVIEQGSGPECKISPRRR